VYNEIKRMDVFSACVPEITMLLRLQQVQASRADCLDPTRGCRNINLIRLGTRYRPFSEESCEFFQYHVATDRPREPCESQIYSEHTLYETRLGVPARFNDIQHIGKTMCEIDYLFKTSHDRMIRDVAPRREDRSPIGSLELLKVTREPYDADCLYLMTLEMLRLAAQYDARPTGLCHHKKSLVRFTDISAHDAKVVLRAVSIPTVAAWLRLNAGADRM
jgi:hypothetical protein